MSLSQTFAVLAVVQALLYVGGMGPVMGALATVSIMAMLFVAFDERRSS